MSAFIVTPSVGGTTGQAFNDLDKLYKDGSLVVDAKNTIRQIQVSAGWVVDGIEISYVPKDKAAPLIKSQHGSKTSQLTTVDLKDSEKLVTVFGRAGKQSYYGRSLINSIGFVIFDQATITTRVVGPVGNNNKSNEGTPFHVSDVAAFGGFAQNTADLGLSGLFFVLDVSTLSGQW